MAKKNVKEAINDFASGVKESAIAVLDETGDGEVNIEDIIIKGLRTPGIRINRESFLRGEFFKRYDEETTNKAIEKTPSAAGIPLEDVDKIADSVIQFERNCVSGISAALGAPGGAAMVATIPADIIQYYGYLLRATQKLLYLYGWPQIDTSEKGSKFDSETINTLIVCMGVMYGTAGANNALKAMAKALGVGVEKKLLNAALTKGTIFPIIKNVGTWFGKKITVKAFAGFFKNALPVVGGVLGGGVTYLTFKPCCDKLKNSLRDTRLSNPDYIETEEEAKIIDAILSGE